MFVVLAFYSALITYLYLSSSRVSPICKRDFVSPAAQGSCLCGEGNFCLCTPSVAADILIELEDESGRVTHVVFVVRRDGRGLAMVGGFVRVGESLEDAAAREALEETGLHIRKLRQWCTFSHPKRDPRRHTVANVFVARARGIPHAADDAKGVLQVSLKELQRNPPRFAFDHGTIVAAYMQQFHSPLNVDVVGGVSQRSWWRPLKRRLPPHTNVTSSCPISRTVF